MIRPDRVTRLYSGLTPEEQAAIAFQFVAEGNQKELSTVEDAIPLRDCHSQASDYTARFNGLFNMAACWAIEYWRTHCIMSELLAAETEHLRRGNYSEAEALLELMPGCRKCLIARIRALEIVCGEHGIDPATVWRFAGAKPPRADPTAESNPEVEAGMAQLLRSILTGGRLFSLGNV